MEPTVQQIIIGESVQVELTNGTIYLPISTIMTDILQTFILHIFTYTQCP